MLHGSLQIQVFLPAVTAEDTGGFQEKGLKVLCISMPVG